MDDDALRWHIMRAMKAPGLTILAACVVLGAAAMGLFRPSGSAPSTTETQPAQAMDPGAGQDPAAELPPGHPPIDGVEPALPPGHPPIDGIEPGLPPDHPPIGEGVSPGEMQAAAPTSDEAASIAWTVPAGWKTLPNPTTMRIATYRPTADSELLVVRAGGSTDANFERWIGQFDDAARSRRTKKTVRGLGVEILEVSGNYTTSGMVPGSAPELHAGWSLLGAVVATPGSQYFFKLVGPSDQVQSAHRSFDALIDSVRPL